MKFSKKIAANGSLLLASSALLSGTAFAQSTFTVMGGRNAASAKTAALISQIKNVNNNQQTAIDSNTNRLDNEVKPHAKVTLAACSASGLKIRWDGTVWTCVTEEDPTVEAFAQTALPTCSSGQVLSADGNGFTCVSSAGGSFEVDPQVGTLTNGKWCTTNGTTVNCTTNAPVGDNLGNHTATANLNMGAQAIISNAGTLRDANGGWVRTYGTSGWYNGTYGGGWYMIDPTWVRSYVNKNVYTAGVMRADGGIRTTQICNTSGTNCVAQTSLGGAGPTGPTGPTGPAGPAGPPGPPGACGGGGGSSGGGSSGGFTGGSCFHPETLVTMANGAQTPLEKVKVGDMVLGLFDTQNEVLALDPTTLGNRILWDINGEIQTTSDHPVWGSDGWGVLSLSEYYHRCELHAEYVVIVDNDGTKETWTYTGLDIDKLKEYGIGSRIGFEDGKYKKITSLKALHLPPQTPLYSLVLAGSHTMLLNGGYVFAGWARDDDFDYDIGQPIRGKLTEYKRILRVFT